MIDKSSSQFKRGVKEEAHEHPGFTRKQIDQVVTGLSEDPSIHVQEVSVLKGEKVRVGEKGSFSALLIHSINAETRRMQKSLDFGHEIMAKRERKE